MMPFLNKSFGFPLFLGVALAVILAGIKLIEYTYFSYKIGLDVYIGIIAFVFLVLGVYFGATYRKRKEEKLMKKLREESRKAGIPEPVINPHAVNGTDLSKRELEVLKEITMGHTNKEIARKLFVSENTIKTHINNIYLKLEVNRRTQAVSRARELKIIT
jgi:two-component system, NarL family, response regulator LiaR